MMLPGWPSIASGREIRPASLPARPPTSGQCRSSLTMFVVHHCLGVTMVGAAPPAGLQAIAILCWEVHDFAHTCPPPTVFVVCEDDYAFCGAQILEDSCTNTHHSHFWRVDRG
jgi:hypothetical protein